MEDKMCTAIQAINKRIDSFLLSPIVASIMRRIPYKHLHPTILMVWLLLFGLLCGAEYIPGPIGSVVVLFVIFFDMYIFAYIFCGAEKIIEIWNTWHETPYN